MAKFLRVSVLYIALSTLIIFAGCSSNKSDNWLIGKWCYDAEMTKENLPTNIQIQGVPNSVGEDTGKLLITQLLDQMNNVKFYITSDKFTSISENGTRKTGTYEIIEKPDTNTMVLKGEDGNISTFIKSSRHICLPCTGAIQFNLYFKSCYF